MRKTNRAPVIIVALLLLVAKMSLSTLPKSPTTTIPKDKLHNRIRQSEENLPAVISDDQPEVIEVTSTDRGIPYIPNIVSDNTVLPYMPNIVGPNAVLPYIPNMIPGTEVSKGIAPSVDLADCEHKFDNLLQSTFTISLASGSTFIGDTTSFSLDQLVRPK